MTRSTRPRSIHQLAAYVLGRQLTRKELAGIHDGPLTHEQAMGLKRQRVAGARYAAAWIGDAGLRAMSPVYCLRAMRRAERWARRAVRLGMTADQAPRHIREKAASAQALTAG